MLHGADVRVIRRAGPEGNVQGMAVAGAAAGFAPKACAGITGARMLVHADEKDAGIALEAGLRAVAVVNVEIDDSDFLELIFLLEILGGDGDVGEEAEAHGAVGLGVMARRSRGRERTLHLAGHDHARMTA